MPSILIAFRQLHSSHIYIFCIDYDSLLIYTVAVFCFRFKRIVYDIGWAGLRLQLIIIEYECLVSMCG